MKNKLSIFLIFYSFIIISTAFAQSDPVRLLKGKVLDSYKKEGVSAATVLIEGTKSGFITDATGQFEIVLPKDKDINILITHISYYPYSFSLIPKADTNRNIVIYLIPKDIELAPVLITGNHFHSKFEEIRNISGLVEGVDLQKNLGLTIAATLKNELGLAIRSMGPAPARPVIRGLGGDRILFTEDGAKTTDLSATSPDHALTIEPFSITRADVIRGPKTILFSPVTIGGVVNIIRHDIPIEVSDGYSINVGSFYESASNGFLIGGEGEYGIGSFAVKGGFTKRNTSDLYTPVGSLKNSFSDITGISGGISFVRDFGFVGASYRSIDMNYGIPGGFVGAHPNGVKISVFRNVYSAKTSINLNTSSLHNLVIHFNRSFYRHKEYEKNDLIGAEFRIIDYSGYLNLEHHIFGFNEDGVIGISWQRRDFEIGGFVFTPKSLSQNFSAYLWQPMNYERLNVELSGRINTDIITPEKDKKALIGLIRERSFITYSLAFSAIYGVTKDLFLGVNLSKSSRVPTIEELFSEGPHLAAYSYEIGNPDLKDESGIGVELFSYFKVDEFYSLVNIFQYNISSFIIPRNTGRINYQTYLPIFATEGVDAIIRGIELQTEYKPIANLSFEAKISLTEGKFLTSGNLPQIPPAKLLIEAKYSPFISTNIDLSCELTSAQNNIDLFETRTDGYVVFNSGLQQSFLFDKIVGLISIGVDNIFNIEYRNHLSRVKVIMPEAGRNFRSTVKIFL
jgi:iron complex outermembrane receptor protein